jgi:5,10-methylene-tetrahydrofolate dehydrogenase/methenyl tetrahydrofolate cyclohydrolase
MLSGCLNNLLSTIHKTGKLLNRSACPLHIFLGGRESMKLKDQTALVTGSSRGIGEATARAFAAEGAQVAIAGRSTHELEALQKEFSGLGVWCVGMVSIMP